MDRKKRPRSDKVWTRLKVQAMQSTFCAINTTGIAWSSQSANGPKALQEEAKRVLQQGSNIDERQVQGQATEHKPEGLANRAPSGSQSARANRVARLPEPQTRVRRPSLPQTPRVVHYFLGTTPLSSVHPSRQCTELYRDLAVDSRQERRSGFEWIDVHLAVRLFG